MKPHPGTFVTSLVLFFLVSMPLMAADPPGVTRISGSYIVEFDEAPLALYTGDIEGLGATNPASRGERKVNSRSPESRAYLDYLDRRQTVHLEQIRAALGRSPRVVFHYRAAANGVAVRMSSTEARIVAGLPGVKRVTQDRIYRQDTDRGPIWIGAPSIWDGSASAGMGMIRGEGVIIGVIDSGVNMDHDSFAATGGDGFTHTNPFGSGTFVGWCDSGNPNFDPSYVCNDKLIGAWDYTESVCGAIPACAESDGPEDDNGHGSHTASTSGGNVLLSPAISGVAPHANLITYDVCYTDTGTGQGLCPFAPIAAAIDQTVIDGVDAINFSISGGGNPWAGDADTFFLGAVAAGIFPAASAGNAGPGPSTVAHLGPWVATIAASTHDRESVANELIDMSGGGAPPADIDGVSRTSGYGPDTIVYAGDFSNGDIDPEQCLTAFAPGTWTAGEIVVCDRGSIARVLKCFNVAAGGAAGCVLGNVTGSGPIVADPHVIPATHIETADADAVRAWLASGSGHTATITDATISVDPALGDIMAGFSSRGPNLAFSALKPDVTAPGSNIFAAFNSDGVLPSPEFGTISGTSMSSPHVAGSGALLSAVHPSWTPSEIKSALMMSGVTAVLKEDGSTPGDPFDFGGGRVDLTKAAEVALVMDETEANYLAADPAAGGDPSTLNVPSLQDNNCVVDCTWTRTVTSVAGGSTTWTVGTTAAPGMTLTADPTGFTLAAGADQVIELTADVTGLPIGGFSFGEITLTDVTEGGSPALHIPAAVQPGLENLPDTLMIETFCGNGMFTLEDVRAAVAITGLDLQIGGLAEASTTTAPLNEDPTNGDPYDDLGQVFVKTVSVPAGTDRLIVATESSESPDADLFVGTGATPSLASQTCTSTTATATERCELTSPAPGTYWILVQNWTGSASQPDDIDVLDVAVPSAASGNFGASGPNSRPAGALWDLELSWNEPAMEEGDLWFGIVEIGTSAGSPGDLGTIAVEITVVPGGIFADGFESGDTSAW